MSEKNVKRSCECPEDYHLSDCPVITGGDSKTSEEYYQMFESQGYDSYYDDTP